MSDDDNGPRHWTAGDYRRCLESALGVPFVGGNHVDVLVNGDRIFPAMIEAIESASQTIEFLTFIYWQGEVASRMGRALADRARAGVSVRVLLDAFGAQWMEQSVIDQLTEAGVEIAWFRPKARWRIWQIDNRTHRKILVVDDRVAFTGGVGIAAEWEGDARNPDEWRETHFRIEGPAIDGLRAAFVSNWVEAGRPGLDLFRTVAPHATPGDVALQVIRTSAAVAYSDVATLFRLALTVADRRIRIATGYFVPDEALMGLMEAAVARGVIVDVLMPGAHNDSMVATMAAEATFERLTGAGINIYRFEPTMMHTKAVLVDDQVAMVGSANFNHRSMGKDDEIVVVAVDEALTGQLIADYDHDLTRTHKIEHAEWVKRGPWQRLREWAGSRLASQA